MTKLQDQLKSVSKTLTNLSKQLETISKKVDKAPAAKVTSKKPVVKKRVVTRPTVSSVAAAKGATVLDSVFDVIRRSRNGASIAKLKEKTGLEARQLSNAL